MPERSEDVEAAVRGWLDAKQAGDGAAIRAGLSSYRDALAIGTDAAEWWAGQGAFIEAHAAAAPFSATIEHVDAHREAAVAWAAVRAVVHLGDDDDLQVRLTLVLVEEDGRWRVVQSHASTPDAG